MPTISKKKLIFLIFGTIKRKNPCAVGKNRRILGRNVVVGPLGTFDGFDWAHKCLQLAAQDHKGGTLLTCLSEVEDTGDRW